MAGLGLVCFLASISDSIRLHWRWPLRRCCSGGIPLDSTWRQRIVGLGVAVLALSAVYPFALDGARAYRNQEIGVKLSNSSSATHPFWHQIYLGLSYIQPNRFGIEYTDTDGFVTALLYDPEVEAQSPAYERDVEHAFASIVASDPGYALADYAEKSVNVVGTTVHIYLVGLVSCAISLLFWRGRRREWWQCGSQYFW